MKWFDHKWPAILLCPFSLLYCVIIFFRNFLYDRGILPSKKLSCLVVSVGNITVGGTGKTPTVMYLSQMWHKMDKKVVILSRGYGRKSKGTVIVSDGKQIKSDVNNSGDEPILLAKNCKETPVVVDSNRVRGAKLALRTFNPDVLILDDAFQHRRLKRDLDIVTIRGENPFGNKFCLPAGPLREPLSYINRADILWLNDKKENSFMDNTFNKPVIQCHYIAESLIDVNGNVFLPNLKGRKIIAFCGLANPQSFKDTLINLGANICEFFCFKDHYSYADSDFEDFRRKRMETGAELILTSEKDWVKCINRIGKDDFWRCVKITLLPGENIEKVYLFEKK